MGLNSDQRDATGLAFVLGQMQADSPFGNKRLRALKFYTKNEKAELLNEFHNIGQILASIKTSDEIWAEARRVLMRFKDITNSLVKLEGSYLHEIELFELKGFMLSLGKLKEAFLNTKISLIDIEFIDMEDALDILDPDKKRIAPFYLSEQYTKELWDIRNEKSRLEELLRTQTDKAELEKLNVMRGEIVAREEATETTVKKDLSEKLRVFLPLFRKNIDAIGKLDFTIQKALLAKAHGATCPDIEGEAVVFNDMINPAVEDVLKRNGKSFTPVSITLGAGTTLLTGANMGGKSVAIKTAVLNVCLCHMGFFVFAKKAVMPIFDGVYMISEDLQSISDGLSTFGAEIVRLNDIVKEAECKHLFIALDEFARGTNPKEGALIVRAVSKYLNTKNSVSIITTHYDNVASEEFGLYQVAGLRSLDFEKLPARIAAGVDGIDLIAQQMDYRLLPVKGTSEPPQDAINICRLLGTERGVLEAIEREYSAQV